MAIPTFMLVAFHTDAAMLLTQVETREARVNGRTKAQCNRMAAIESRRQA